jgi:hypothetical protein
LPQSTQRKTEKNIYRKERKNRKEEIGKASTTEGAASAEESRERPRKAFSARGTGKALATEYTEGAEKN